MGAQPETRLMPAIFSSTFEDRDLRTEVNGVSLVDALMEVVPEVPDYTSMRKDVPIHIRSRNLIELQYGFVDRRMHFLKDLADRFGMPMSTIAVCYAKVMKSLRSFGVRGGLQPYVKREPA